MEIPFQGRFNLSMLRRMTWTAIRPTRGRLITITIFVTLFLWGAIGVPLMDGGGLADLWPALRILGVMLLVVLLFAYLFFVWGPKKQLAGDKTLQGPMTGVVREEGLYFETPFSKADLPWSVFTKTKIGKDVILLYHSTVGGQCNLLPRELFASDQDWDTVVEQVRRNTPVADMRGRREARAWLWVLLLLVAAFLALFVYNVLH